MNGICKNCPECGGPLFYDIPVKRHICKSCGIYVTKDQLREMRDNSRDRETDERRRKNRDQGEYLDWWLSKK